MTYEQKDTLQILKAWLRTQVHFLSTKVITTIMAFLQQPAVAPS